MRTISFYFVLVLTFVTACNKGENVPAPHVNTFSANVNGIAFIPANIEMLYGGSSVPGAKQVNIAAIGANGHEVTLIMLDYDGTLKTFTNNIGAYSIAPGLYHSSYSISGEIKISSIDKNTYKDGEVATGTFQFDTDSTVGTYHITSGNFSVFVKH